jgi:hypothetical protein
VCLGTEILTWIHRSGKGRILSPRNSVVHY